MDQYVQSLFSSLSRNAGNLPFEVHLWNGDHLTFGKGTPRFLLRINNKKAIRDVIVRGTIGFGEEYMAGGIDIEGKFEDVCRLGVDSRYQNIKPPLLLQIPGIIRRIAHRDTDRRVPKNVAHHYDRGNEFFSLWLDSSMTYSCAYFRREEDSLEKAQEQKYEHLCRKLLLKQGETLLDIGCGWGGMLRYAARKYGTKAAGCTLSKNQFEYVQRKIREEKLEGQVSVQYRDYRAIEGSFDKLVSVGMFEHVGQKFIPVFMRKARELLRPGGIGVLHTIGNERESNLSDWTAKYIFPGGYIPTLCETLRELARAGLESVDVENLRLHYARTLDHWAERFESNVERIRTMFGESFVRMWRMFLVGSAAGFRYGESRLYQIVFTNGLNNTLPMTREYLYA